MDLTDWLFVLFALSGIVSGWRALVAQREAGARNRARLHAEDARRARRLAEGD